MPLNSDWNEFAAGHSKAPVIAALPAAPIRPELPAWE